MKLSISNIAWISDYDNEMYLFLKNQSFCGLEIAPTRIFPQSPYDCLAEAASFAKSIKMEYGLDISSMQSLWYGITENIFFNEHERDFLIEYTKKAILFAEVLNCRNIVFGCPKNRSMPSSDSMQIATQFFTEIGEYALLHNTVIAIEPLPPYYNTNFINTTGDAFDFCKGVNNAGIKVNVDIGTMLHYGESIRIVCENIDLVNHIHISEPSLAPIRKRNIHAEFKTLNYNGYFSIEMANSGNIEEVKQDILYVRDVFM